MPRKPTPCVKCGKFCHGTHCSTCSKAVRRKRTAKPKPRPVVVSVEPVGKTWWLDDPGPDGFTKRAGQHVVPEQDKKSKAYNWQIGS